MRNGTTCSPRHQVSKAHNPELKNFMVRSDHLIYTTCITPARRIMPKPARADPLQDKKMSLKLNGNRRVAGILRGYDPFM